MQNPEAVDWEGSVGEGVGGEESNHAHCLGA